MNKIITCTTFEIDDAQAALSEILAQIEAEGGLLENSSGYFCCHSDFFESGVTAAVEAALPFEIVGVNASCSAANGHNNNFLFSLTIITSDTASFKIFKETLGDGEYNCDSGVRALCGGVLPADGLSAAFLFMGMTSKLSGDALLRSVDKVFGGAPIFGGLASSQNGDFSGGYVYFDGTRSTEAYVIIALYNCDGLGYKVAPYAFSTMASYAATITKASGNRIYEINYKSALDFIKEMRLDGETIFYAPIMVTLEDGSKTARGMARLDETDGSVVCLGEMQEGSTVRMTMVNEDIIRNSTAALMKSLKNGDYKGLLLVNCIVRGWVTSGKPQADAQEIDVGADGKYPTHMFYSNGEFCPVPNANGALVNRFHNYSLVACAFT